MLKMEILGALASRRRVRNQWNLRLSRASKSMLSNLEACGAVKQCASVEFLFIVGTVDKFYS